MFTYEIDSQKCAHVKINTNKVNGFSKIDVENFDTVLRKLSTFFPDEIRLVSFESEKISPNGFHIFCAGANQKERLSWSVQEKLNHVAFQRQVIHSLRTQPYWTVSCVDGLAIGLGVEICLASDFVFASPRAYFSFPELSLGIIPGAGGYAWAHHWAKDKTYAQQIINSGEKIDSLHAQYAGIVDVCCEKDDFCNEINVLSFSLSFLSPEEQIQRKKIKWSSLNFDTFFQEEQSEYEKKLMKK